MKWIEMGWGCATLHTFHFQMLPLRRAAQCGKAFTRLEASERKRESFSLWPWKVLDKDVPWLVGGLRVVQVQVVWWAPW